MYYIILYLFIYLSSYLFIYFFISIHFCKWIRSFGSGIVYTWAWRHRVWAVPLAVNPFVMVRTKRYWSWRHWFTLEFRQNFNVSVIYIHTYEIWSKDMVYGKLRIVFGKLVRQSLHFRSLVWSGLIWSVHCQGPYSVM